MITVEQLRDELSKAIEAGNGNKEVKIDYRDCWVPITGLYYVDQSFEQVFDPLELNWVSLEFAHK